MITDKNKATKNSPNWGGSRPGSGRPPTGRKRRNFYITEKEDDLLRKYLEIIRERKQD